MRKTVPSAFVGTSLGAWLTQRGVRRPVVSDCVADRAIGPHEANLFDMAQKYAAVMARDEALAAIARAARDPGSDRR